MDSAADDVRNHDASLDEPGEVAMPAAAANNSTAPLLVDQPSTYAMTAGSGLSDHAR